MAFRLLALNPLGWVSNQYGTTNVAKSASWVQISGASGADSSSSAAGLPSAATALEIFDSSGSTMELAVGAAGQQKSLGFLIPPGGDTIMVPCTLAKGALLWARAKDANATTGELIVNLYG